jgi:hypothetical protein
MTHVETIISLFDKSAAIIVDRDCVTYSSVTDDDDGKSIEFTVNDGDFNTTDHSYDEEEIAAATITEKGNVAFADGTLVEFLCTKKSRDNIAKVLAEFCQSVDDTGGVGRDRKGLLYPVADEEWSDLGQIYENACVVLNRPLIIESEEE